MSEMLQQAEFKCPTAFSSKVRAVYTSVVCDPHMYL